MRARLAESRIAHLATADAGGRPHIVPITFAVDGQHLYFAVDAKPKRTTDLRRIRNIQANSRVSVLVDEYSEDWGGLWWVRVDGQARVLEIHTEIQQALDLLALRYAQYRQMRPPGPVVAISIDRMTGWAANENSAR